jgi:hypothetical protein
MRSLEAMSVLEYMDMKGRRKYGARVWTEFSWFRICGLLLKGNKPSSSIKREQFEQLNDYQLLKTAYNPWNYFLN